MLDSSIGMIENVVRPSGSEDFGLNGVVFGDEIDLGSFQGFWCE